MEVGGGGCSLPDLQDESQVSLTGKSPSKAGRPGELPEPVAPGALMFPLGSLMPQLKQ